MRTCHPALLLPCVLCSVLAISIQAQRTATPAKHSCSVDDREEDPGQKALAGEAYTSAETFYRAALQTTPSSQDAALGLVEALLGEDKLEAARSEAVKMGVDNALGDVALAEVAYRSADLDATETHVLTAMQKNPCEGRVLAIAAHMVALNAMYAREARYLATAHTLRPHDEIIERDWIESLPTEQRQTELQKYLAGPVSLSPDQQRDYDNETRSLKARHEHSCTISAVQSHLKLPFTAVLGSTVYDQEAFGLQAQINGQTRNLEIDSGASGILLTPDAAKKLNLAPEYRLKTSGVGDEGAVNSYLTHVAKIEIGGVTLTDCSVEVLQKGSMYADGLIGLDVFGRWITTIDYKKREVRLDPLPARPEETNTSNLLNDAPLDRYIAPDMTDWLHILRIGHMILLPSRLSRGPLHYLIADTGSQVTMFDLSVAPDIRRLPRDYNTRIQGISGYVKNVYTASGKLQIGQFTLPDQNFPAYDMTSLSHGAGFQIGGLFGASDLKRFTISLDYRDNLMLMRYNGE